MPAAALIERSRAIAERIVTLSLFEAATSIALFWPIAERREVDLRAVDAAARVAQKAVYYPFMEPAGEIIVTGFRRVDDVNTLADCGRGFCEPPREAPRATAGALSLIVVPALAVAADGHRLGYGAGFYDATLPEFCPPARSVVVAFDFQLLAELPTSERDVSCDLVLTDRRVIDAKGALVSM